MQARALRFGRLAVIVTLLCGVAGCSGSLPVLSGAGHATAELVVDQAQASALVSEYRRQHGLAAVGSDPRLQRVAQAQADAMASADRLSHTLAGPLPKRLSAYGGSQGASIENVSAGYASLDAALGGWRRSPEHNENLLYPPMRRIGVAAASAPGTRFKRFWALVMTD